MKEKFFPYKDQDQHDFVNAINEQRKIIREAQNKMAVLFDKYLGCKGCGRSVDDKDKREGMGAMA